MKLLYNLQDTYQLADKILFSDTLRQRITYAPKPNQDWICLPLNSFETRRRQRQKYHSSIDNYFNVPYLNPTALLTRSTIKIIKRTAFYPQATTTKLDTYTNDNSKAKRKVEKVDGIERRTYNEQREEDIRRDVEDVVASTKIRTTTNISRENEEASPRNNSTTVRQSDC